MKMALFARVLLPAALLSIAAWQVPASAATSCTQGSTCVSVDGSGGNPLNTEAARQSKEQWNSTHNLRNKVNQRVEKDFDKVDKAVDVEEKCNNSQNLNAYWEPNSLRCLDRHTGRQISNP